MKESQIREMLLEGYTPKEIAKSLSESLENVIDILNEIEKNI